ncbi:MAG: hypothetical protein AAFX94_07485, partial [Myxococcota bacterium]
DAGLCVDPNGGSTPAPRPNPDNLPGLDNGEWSVEYRLDWSDYLGSLQDLGSEIDLADSILNGALGSIPGGEIFTDFIDQYIPAWVGDLVRVLNNVVTFFQDVRLIGTMRVEHDQSDFYRLVVRENWTNGFVEFVDQCGELGKADPRYPSCAQMNIPLNDFITEFGSSIRVQPIDYSGRIVEVAPNQYSVAFEERAVEVEIGKFLRFVLDRATQVVTNNEFPTLAIALASTVNCGGVSANVEDSIWCTVFRFCDPDTMLGVCTEAVQLAAGAVEDQLDEVAVDLDVMRFNSSAELFYSNGVPRRATALGNSREPGVIENGFFELGRESVLTGTWRAWRR